MNAESSEYKNLRGLALRGIGWTAVEKWGIRLLSVVVFVILLRTMEPEEFGLASFTTAIVTILLVFVDAGFPKALIQKKELDKDDATTAFWTSAALAFLIYVLVFFTAPLVATVTDMPELTAMLRVLGLALLVTAFSSVPAALLERDMNFRSLGLRSIFGTFAGAVIAIPMAVIGMGVWALIAQTLSTLTVGAIALWFSTSWRPAFRYSVPALRAMASFGLSVLGIEFLTRVQQNIDKLLINVLLGPAVGGIYFVAQRALKIISELIASVISKIALTTFSKLQDDRERLNRVFLQLTFAAGAVAVPFLGIVAALGDIIFPYVAGDEQWDLAVPIMQILAFSSALAVIVRFDKQTLLAVGEPRRAFVLGLLENIVGVVLLIVAAPYGLIALAIGRSVRIFVLWPYRLYLLRRYASIAVGKYLFNSVMLFLAIAVPIGVMLLVSLTPWRDTHPAFWTYAAPMSVIMLLIYFGVLWVVCGRENRNAIRRTFKLKRRSKLGTPK